MRIALVEASPKPKFYPIALLKLGAWRLDAGDDCELYIDRLPAAGEFDEIWLSTRFTYDLPHALGLTREATQRAPHVKVGGIAATLLPQGFEREGAEVHRGLVPEAESAGIAYELLDEIPDYSITYTSRGCSCHCKFCMVPKLEPEFLDRPDWPEDLHQNTRMLYLFDNNWLAKDQKSLFRDIAALHALVDQGRIVELDFNQGLDCRLMTEEIADRLRGLPFKRVRFAFDGMQEDGHYQRAVRMMVDRGFDDFITYVLYNFMDTPQDFYYRLRVSVELSAELGVWVRSFPMRYQPIMSADVGRRHVGPHWTMRKRNAFQRLKASWSGHSGLIAAIGGIMEPIEEFEFWCGSTAEEFDKMLAYPDIGKLVARKKGFVRMKRAKEGKKPCPTSAVGGTTAAHSI